MGDFRAGNDAAEQPAAREPELRHQLWRTRFVILGVLPRRHLRVMLH
jgi:hypothetical protein